MPEGLLKDKKAKPYLRRVFLSASRLKKVRFWGFMADVISEGSVFSPYRSRSSAISTKMVKPLFANLFRSSIGFARSLSSSKNGLLGRRLVIERQKGKVLNRDLNALPVKMDFSIGKGMRWWEKGVQPNMKEIASAQDLVDSLLHAGDKLVIVDFFSPGCAGCKSLHPKICQFAEQNPNVLFLPVNYEKHKSMCYSLNVHVLPFFRFYRGAHGRLCSFSCTNATIRKFKDALAKYSTDGFSLGAAKGLEEKELLALAANRDLSFNQTKKKKTSSTASEIMEQVPAIL